MAWNIGTEEQRLSCPSPPKGKLMDFDAFRRGEGCVYRTLFEGPSPPAAHFGPQGAFTITPKPKSSDIAVQVLGGIAPLALGFATGSPLGATTALGSLSGLASSFGSLGGQKGGTQMAGLSNIFETGLSLLSGFRQPSAGFGSFPQSQRAFTTAASAGAVVVRGAALVPQILRMLAAKMGVRRITLSQFWSVFKKFGPSFFAGALTAQEMQALVTHAATRRHRGRGVTMSDMRRTKRTMRKMISFSHDLRSLCGGGGSRPVGRRPRKRCK